MPLRFHDSVWELMSSSPVNFQRARAREAGAACEKFLVDSFDGCKDAQLTSAIDVASRSMHWERALWILQMAPPSMNSNTTKYNFVSHACAKAGEWEWATQLLAKNALKGLVPDMVLFNNVVKACGERKKWSFSIHLVDVMQYAASFTASGLCC